MMLEWVGSRCRHREPVEQPSCEDTDPGYAEGDAEPCVHCDDDDCVAVVQFVAEAADPEPPR